MYGLFKLMKTKKAQIWISALLYTMIIVVSVVFILQAGTPMIEGMRDKLVFTKTKNQLVSLDQQIEEVASEGKGSQRVIPIELDKGNLYLEDGTFKWEFETDSKVIEPKSSQKIGNLLISSNSNAQAFSNSTHYVMQNSRIKVVLPKFGSEDNQTALNTSQLIESVTILSSGQKIPISYSFRVANDDASSIGTGYTEFIKEGNYMTSATYKVHMFGSYDYILELILDSNADYVKSRITDFKAN